DASGAVQSVTQYDAWGNEQAISGTPSDPFGYNAQSGYYLDRETGLYLCQHRFYDPANGRWLNRDPIAAHAGPNLYGYCFDSPTGWLDQDGQAPGKGGHNKGRGDDPWYGESEGFLKGKEQNGTPSEKLRARRIRKELKQRNRSKRDEGGGDRLFAPTPVLFPALLPAPSFPILPGWAPGRPFPTVCPPVPGRSIPASSIWDNLRYHVKRGFDGLEHILPGGFMPILG
ncbi:MAG: RHS repeat-associated core domain-containing protein, partial [Fimbriimonadaceae bacterium]